MEKDTIENRNSNNDNKAQRYAALSNWRWAQHHAEMEENNVQILNMLDGKKTYPLQETSKTNVLQHPLNTQKKEMKPSSQCLSKLKLYYYYIYFLMIIL